jgi:N-acetylglucosamine-6-sulfatase
MFRTILALLAFAVIGTSAGAQQPKRPNIVFIFSDDHRWDALGAAGNKAVHTPNLDRLAAEGIYFRQGTVHVPQCSPSRATLLTGLAPHQHGYYSNQHQRPDATKREGFGFPTLPLLLRMAGYRTVLVGKWHIFPDPWKCGFSDVRTWMPGGGGPYLDPPLAQGQSRATKKVKGFITEIFVNDAIDFLKGPAARDGPFFLWLATTAPHSPYAPNPEHVQQRYAAKAKTELLPPGFPRDIKTGKWHVYYEAVTHLDEQVGRLLKVLKEQGLEDNTIVVFLGDNGYMMGSRGWFGKVVPYEESVRVPFIIRAPKLAGFKGTSEAPVSSLDLPVTWLSIAGAKAPKDWPGRDLTPLLRGDKRHDVTEAYCEWADTVSDKFGHLGYRLVRTPTHKLIVWDKAGKSDELYDLTADPREMKNLVNEPAAREVRDDLRRRLRLWMERTNDPALKWLSH